MSRSRPALSLALLGFLAACACPPRGLKERPSEEARMKEVPSMGKPIPVFLHPKGNSEWARMKKIPPRGYVCYRASGPIRVDGRLDEASWAAVPWTEDFADIEGPRRPAPRFRTRAKMLWDDDFFYVAARLEEPHLVATITKKNAVIFHDNDFEVFIDPDGDNHYYYEFEMNALNTIWELTLERPYRDGGPVHLGDNMPGLKSAVHLEGTLNDPSDTDRAWTVEIAFPWKGLRKYARHTPCPPKEGDQWRIDFSRVEWLYDIIHGRYRKIPKEARPEDNWVWSPIGVIDMHRPERWGYVQFTRGKPGTVPFRPDPTLPARDYLMAFYYDWKSHPGEKAGSETFATNMSPAPGVLGLVVFRRRGKTWFLRCRARGRKGKLLELILHQDSLLEVRPVE